MYGSRGFATSSYGSITEEKMLLVVQPSSLSVTSALIDPTLTSIEFVDFLGITASLKAPTVTVANREIVIKVNNIDISNQVASESLFVSNNLYSDPDTASFNIIIADSKSYNPQAGDEIQIIDTGTVIFEGLLIKQSKALSGFLESYSLEFKDWTEEIGNITVAETYTNATVEDIIADIFTDSNLSAYDGITNVSDTTIISRIVFDNISVTEALDNLANLSNKHWYVSPAKEIFFFADGTIPAPFNLSDTSGNYNYSSLTINEDLTQIRNRVTVKGSNIAAVTVEDVASQTTYGLREYFVRNDEINATNEATQSANAILDAFKDSIKVVTFQTNENGLFSGQQIDVESQIRGGGYESIPYGEFDGIDDYVNRAYQSSYDCTSVTMSLWVKVEKVSSEAYALFSMGRMIMYVYVAGTEPKVMGAISSTTATGADSYPQGSSPFEYNEWTLLTCVYNEDVGGGQAKIYNYINGIEVASANHIGGILNKTFALEINTRKLHKGNTGDVRYYKRALSANEILDIYNKNNINDAELEVNYDFIKQNNDDTTLYDISGNNNDGTVVGMTFEAQPFHETLNIENVQFQSNSPKRFFYTVRATSQRIFGIGEVFDDALKTPETIVPLSDQNSLQNISFTAIDNQTIQWSAGTITLSDGTSYSISAKTSQALTSDHVIYFDKSVSETVLQISTNFADGIGEGKIALAYATRSGVSTKGADIFPVSFGGQIQLDGSVHITDRSIIADNIAANSITANEITANTITANEMNVSQLSAISANIGAITAGTITGTTITGATFRTASSGRRIQMTTDQYIRWYDGASIEGSIYTDSSGNMQIKGYDSVYMYCGTQSTDFIWLDANAGDMFIDSNDLFFTQTGDWQINQADNIYINFYDTGFNILEDDVLAFRVDSGKDTWIADNCSADSFTDRTPYYEGDALEELSKIKGIKDKDGKLQIDHTTLPTFTSKKLKVPKKEKVKRIKGKVIIEEVEEEGRDLGATISMLVVAVNQLNERTKNLIINKK